MRYLLQGLGWLPPAALLVALATLTASTAAQDDTHLTQKETLDLFFSSVATRLKLEKAVSAMGVDGHLADLLADGRLQSVMQPPWLSPDFMEHTSRVLDSNIEKLIETARQLIETVAEPLKIEFVNLNRSEPMAEITGYVQNMKISKLSTFKVDDLQLNVFFVNGTIKVHFDTLDVHGNYNVDGFASGQLHIFGDGDFDIRIYEPTVEVDVRMAYDDQYFSVDVLNIYIKIAKLKLIMRNFLGGGAIGDMVSGVISDVAPAFLDEYRYEVSDYLSKHVKETANALLAKVPIDTIIDWLSGGDN